jgi:opacity protein-like surface antigen
MKKIAFLFLLSLAAFSIKAQQFHVTVFGGFSNYQGDLQDKRFTLNQSHPAFGAGLLYEITDNLSARANVTFGKISGDDSKNAKNAVRNLSFASPITDIHLGLEYALLNPYEHSLSPYLFAGISYFKFNPSAKDTAGRKVFLQPLSTEGQGFYQGRKKYKLGQLSIPFGGGVKFSFSENVRLAIEVGLRKTNTDYLDDVSTTYIDQNILLLNRGQQAVDLAFRGDELKTGLSYPADATQRGGKSKDWYYFSGINLSIRLQGKGNGGRGGSSGGKFKTGCPTNF